LQQDRQKDERQADKAGLEIDMRLGKGGRGRCQHAEQRVADQPAAQRHQSADDQEETTGRAARPPNVCHVPPPHGLPNQNGRSHGEAEHGRKQQEKDHRGHRRPGQRIFANQLPDIDGADGLIERLQDIPAQRRQRENKEGFPDGALGQILHLAHDGGLFGICFWPVEAMS
jgi:hypothetical protein